MTQIVLPHTIDAGTEITAAEHQLNYEAIRDAVNGNLEGGSGVAGNIKANGITAREVEDTLMLELGRSFGLVGEGVITPGDLRVTPGSGLNLNVAAGVAAITDDSGIVASGALVRANYAGGTVTVGANSSGNPRIDQVIFTLTGWNTGTVSVLAGTATAGATLANRTGAAALPSGAIRLADILMPNGFAGPFVQTTHIRDRWLTARPVWQTQTDATLYNVNGANTTRGTVMGLRVELESSNDLVEFSYLFQSRPVDTASNAATQITRDGAAFALASGPVDFLDYWLIGGGSHTTNFAYYGTMSPGSVRTDFTNPNQGRFPHYLSSWFDTPGAGSHIYQPLHGGTGNGGQIQNQTMRVRVHRNVLYTAPSLGA